MRALFALLAPMTLGACVSAQETATALRSKWDGKAADAFFVQHGPPVSSYAMNDGGKIFTWEGGKDSVPIAGVSTTSTRVVGRTAVVTTETSPGTEIHMGCRLQIVTDKSGTILQLKPVADTIGHWQLSRCAEIFPVT